MVCSEAKENIMKSLQKLGLTNIGTSNNAYLMLMKDCLASLDHLKVLYFFNILFIYFTTSTKFVMNLLRKLTLPRNDWISFLFLGRPICCMAATLYGSMLMPLLEMIWPKSFPSSIAFFGLREMPNFLHLRKTLLRCCNWSGSVLENTVISSR